MNKILIFIALQFPLILFPVDDAWQKKLIKALTDNDISTIKKCMEEYGGDENENCTRVFSVCRKGTDRLCSSLKYAKTTQALSLLFAEHFCEDHKTKIDIETIDLVFKWYAFEPSLLDQLLKIGNLNRQRWHNKLTLALDENNIPLIKRLMTCQNNYNTSCGTSSSPCSNATDLLCTCFSHAKTTEALSLLLLKGNFCSTHTTIDNETIIRIFACYADDPHILTQLVKIKGTVFAIN